MAQKVDILLTNAILLTMDGKLNQYDPGAIAIKGDVIVAVGPEAEIIKEYSAKENMDCGNKVLSTGRTYPISHTSMPIPPATPDNIAIDAWLRGYVHPADRHLFPPTLLLFCTYSFLDRPSA